MTSPRLSPAERDRIYERRIRPDVLSGALASKTPAAMLVAGQPGAGLPVATATLRRELTKTTGGLVHLSEERLRPYHPHWRSANSQDILRADAIQPDVTQWFDRVIQDAQRHRFHMLVEDELLDPRAVHRMAVALRKDAYMVQAVFVVTPRDESTLAVMAQFDRLRERGLPSRFVSAQEHDIGLANVRVAMGLVEDRRSVDGIRLVDRDAKHFYENRLDDSGEWRKDPRGQAALDILRDKGRPPKDQVKFAMRWETLTQRLVHDPELSREVASQALMWRNESAARCEAVPGTAQMLQWAREGAAFRIMDRFDFEKEFPHHARAVSALGAAVIEAEKYDPKESARFLASARENIASRIERGDMARIAAREIAMKEKLKDPPTR